MGPKNSFGFGIVAMIAALIFALSVPAAVNAQTPAPAPAPTSDGNVFYADLISTLLIPFSIVWIWIVHSFIFLLPLD